MTDIDARRAFGREVLGPIFAAYLLKLHQAIGYFEPERRAKVLFVTRAGVRIRTLYLDFCASTGAEPSSTGELFQISRLLTAKGSWSKCPENTLALFRQEYGAGTLGEAVQAILRQASGQPACEPDPSWGRPGSELQDYLSSGEPWAQATVRHLEEQSRLFGRYLDGLLGDRRTVLLVDSGWQGTAQRLLADMRPDVEWWGAYFGRFGFPRSDRTLWPQMLGLVLEDDEFDWQRPETAIILHRHLIEHLLEPLGPSMETLVESEGTISAIGSERIIADRPTPERDSIFIGVQDYLRGDLRADPGPGAILIAAQRAHPLLARMLALPVREEADLLGGGHRSADFGRDLMVPVLLPSKDRHASDSAQLRIEHSLWPQGQIALEYPTHLAATLQRQLAKIDGAGETSPSAAHRKAAWALAQAQTIGEVPRVCIATRTMDRPAMLIRALSSVAAQDMTDYVHIVVCDGGPIPPVVEAIESSPADLRRVWLIDNVVNRGMEAASNIAIGAGASDYILVHDDDDTLEPEFLRETVSFLDSERGQKYGGVVTQSIHVSEELVGEEIREHGRWPYNGWMRSVYLDEMILGNYFPPIAFVFRRSVYDEIGGFSEDLPVLGDWDFNLRFLARADIAAIPRPLSNYHHRDVGNVQLYGNSVLAGRNLHEEYDVIVRNRHLRATGNGALAALIGQSQSIREIRGVVRELAQESRVLESCRAEFEASNGELLSCRANLDAYKADSERCRAEREAYRRGLEAYRTSTSWRLTAPLRAVAIFLRRLGRNRA